MQKDEPPIQTLALKMIAARGPGRFTRTQILKGYLESITDDRFRQEMERVTDVAIFRHLMSMGLSLRRQEWLTKAWIRLTK